MFIPVTPGGPTNPVGIVTTIIGFIAELFGFGGGPDLSAITTAVNNTYSNLVTTTAFLYNAIGFLTNFLKRLIGTIVGGIAHIISDVLHGHLLRALQDIQALLHALHNLFAPLLDWLRRLQRIQRQLQMQYLRKILNLFQTVRSILAPFRILHFKFAQKLDAELARIEGRIISRALAPLIKTNQIIDALNMFLDPLGAYRFNHAAVSLGRLADSFARIFTGRGFDWWYTRGPRTTGPLPAPITATQHYTALRSDLRAGAGDVPGWRGDFQMWRETYKAVR